MNNYYFPDLSNISGDNFVKIFEHFKFIFKDKTKDRFLIATSGGPDSILLLYLVCKYFPDYKNKIGVQGGDYYKPVEYKSKKTTLY